MDNLWDRTSAQRYVEYCDQHDTYHATSAALVAAVAHHLGSPTRVVDLACGTGVTAAEILRRFGAELQLTCIDPSEAMLDAARQAPQLRAAVFVQCPAEEVDHHVLPGVDLMTCNSGFWLMNMPAALRAASRTLRVGGLFAFSIPGYLLCESVGGACMGQSPVLMDEFTRAACIEPTVDSPRSELPSYALSEEALIRMATRTGYTLHDRKAFNNAETVTATYDALRIPALLVRYAPNLALDRRLLLLQEIAEKLALSPPTNVTWFSYVLRRS